MTGPAQVLALNSGSSSLKFGLFSVSGASAEAVISGGVETAGKGERRFWARDSAGRQIASETDSGLDQEGALHRIGAILSAHVGRAPDVVGHRIVHGGPRLSRHCLIDAGVMHQLEAATALAPLHVPQALSVVRLARERFPRCPHVACFDTAFHAELPEIAHVLPIPRELRSEGIRRYGFHGLSCESIVRRLGRDLPERLVIAHLGNGASITAVRHGRSVDTTMGLTPTGGVVMGTRCGDIDPGVLLYLIREKRADATWIEQLVNRRSGLLGISGVDGDMRRLHEAAATSADARLAIDIFCYSVRKQVAAMIAALDGIDLLVFTGGIGEHDPIVRASICGGLSWHGIFLDPERNGASRDSVSAVVSRCRVRILPAEEDVQIALHARTLIEGATAG